MRLFRIRRLWVVFSPLFCVSLLVAGAAAAKPISYPGGTMLMGKGNKVFAMRPGVDSAWKEIASYADPGLQSLTTYVMSPSGDKLILISPVKPALHQAIRDSLQSGKTMSEALRPYASMSAEAIRSGYEISRGVLSSLASEYRARKPADGPIIDSFIARVAPPAP